MKRALAAVVALIVAAVAVRYMTRGVTAARPMYLTAAMERGEVMKTVTATGAVKAVVTVAVGSQLSGQIAKLFVDFNDDVHQGQPIAELDQSVYLAKVREAEAALEAAKTTVAIQEAAVQQTQSKLATAQAGTDVLAAKTARADAVLQAAQRELQRAETLRGKGVASESQLDQAQTARDAATADQREAEAQEAVHAQEIKTAAADLTKAEAELANAGAIATQKSAELAQAQVELERTVIRSPIDGIVIGRKVDRGQTVAASLKAPTLFTIAEDLRQMEVHARIDEADIGRIRRGQRATFSVDAFPRRHFTARVIQIRRAPEVEKNVVTYTVVLAAPNPERLLLPGMTALVDIVVQETSDVLHVPNAALRFHPAGPEREAAGGDLAGESEGSRATLWLLGEDGKPKPVQVRLGLTNATETAILSGPLHAGEKVIVGTAPDQGGGPFGVRLGF